MKQKKSKEEAIKEAIYFYDRNYVVMIGGASIVLGSTLFWTVYNLFTNDSMCYISSGAIWSEIVMIAASAAIILIGKKLRGIEHKSSREIKIWTWVCMIYFGLLFIMVGMVTGAGVICATAQGAGKSIFTVNLASMLLILPAIATMPKKLCGYIQMVELFGFAFIPYWMPGTENYSITQELVLRICLMTVYIILNQRTFMVYQMDQEMEGMRRRMDKTNEEVIELLVNAVEVRDTQSGAHVKNVREFTRLLAEDMMIEYPEFDLTREYVDYITRASVLHDIGKIMIPDSILLKPGKLTAEEWEIMMSNSEKGFELLGQAPKAWGEDLIRISKEICLYHHEKYDGSGYPMGLVAEEIPVWAQIVSVADCYDALTSRRPYKDACSPEEAYDMILKGECGVFSEKILKSLGRVKEDFARVATEK